MSSIYQEWVTLRTYIISIMANNRKENYYLGVWLKVVTNTDIKEECKNVLHIIVILLCTSFTNAKFERGFSRMTRVKQILEIN